MERKRDGLVSIGDALSGMGGPMKSIREASPQALHHFTQADQVHQLVGASESGPGSRLHGADDGAVLPAPHQPRQPPPVQARQRPVQAHHDGHRGSQAALRQPAALLMAWLSTEAVRTQSREISLGDSLAEFMRALGIYNSGGNPQTRLRNQMRRLFHCTVSLIYEDERGAASASVACSRPHRVLVERTQARRAESLGE